MNKDQGYMWTLREMRQIVEDAFEAGFNTRDDYKQYLTDEDRKKIIAIEKCTYSRRKFPLE